MVAKLWQDCWKQPETRISIEKMQQSYVQQNYIKDYVNMHSGIFKQAALTNWTSATTFQSIHIALAVDLMDWHGLSSEACC